MLYRILTALIFCVTGVAQALPCPPDNDTMLFYVGGSARIKAGYAFAGFIGSLNSSLDKSGVRYKAHFGIGRYHYRKSGIPFEQSKITGKLHAEGASLGFEAVKNENRLALFLGPYYSSNKISKVDLQNKSQGHSLGAKVDADFKYMVSRTYYFEGNLAYGSRKNEVWGRIRPSGDFMLNGTHAVAGPEYTYNRIKGFFEHRFGLFLTLGCFRSAHVTLNAGGAHYKVPGKPKKHSSGYVGLQYAHRF